MRHAGRSTRRPGRWALAALLLGLAPPELPAVEGVPESLPPRYQRWLEDVGLLIGPVERDAFLGIAVDYQRDHFIRRFWQVRDPFPQTAVNEFQKSWEQRAESARELFGGLEGDGPRMLLFLGDPARRERLLCTEVMEALDVWYYPDGSDRIAGYFTVVFTGNRMGERFVNYRLWQPSFGLRQLVNATHASAARAGEALLGSDPALARFILAECVRGDDILSALSTALDAAKLERFLPRPSEEWVAAFQARSTDVPEDAEPLAGELAVSFPGRHQSRTVVQGIVAVPRDAATASSEGPPFYNLLLDGEVLRQGRLFDTFRYRFDFPAGHTAEVLPLVAQRYLRPGDYQLIVKVEDVHSRRVFRQVLDLTVPVYDPTVVDNAVVRDAVTADAVTLAVAATPRTLDVPRLLEEGNRSISTGDHAIEILPLSGTLLVGKVRVTARASGEGIVRVAFELNGVAQMRKARPPYSVELDLGARPRIHTLRAVALDAGDRLLAVDEVMINSGPQRFAVRLIEPQPGKRYTHSVRVHAEVEVPEGDRLDRVELFLNETPKATLYQPPFEQPLLLEEVGDFAYVRAIAYLADGNSTEEVVVINAPDVQDVTRVNFVELYTSVVTKKGEFVDDLAREEVKVLEDGEAQEIRRFEKVSDLPITAGLMIDTSTSMADSLRDVRRAAHRFLTDVLAPRDRAAVMTFNDAPRLVVRFTSDTEVLAGGLAGLVAEGETALYDSVIFALHYLSGGSGKRAIVLLTDGEDSSSTYSFEDAIEFARHTGVSIYLIGLGLPSDPQARSQVRMLATETGGETYFIDRVAQLTKVYESIQQELRSQYLIAYQSSRPARAGDDFRRVEVVVDRKGVEAKTLRGYYP
jgi:Ca-activated chloride channel family protein